MKLPSNFESILHDELLQRVVAGRFPNDLIDLLYKGEGGNAAPRAKALGIPRISVHVKAIYDAYLRPSLIVQDNTFAVPNSDTWQEALGSHRSTLEEAIPSVGRIEIEGHPQATLVGTGFLVSSRTVVTNRHVADIFAERQGDGFTWRTGDGGPMAGNIDFLAEYERKARGCYPIDDILHIADASGPDLALLRLGQNGADLAPLSLSASAEERDVVAAIGYPSDVHAPSAETAAAIAHVFGSVFDVKRLAPGVLKSVGANGLTHDCSTLVGSSGSPVVDVETGEVVAVHFGPGLEGNLGVPARRLVELVERVG